MSKYKTLKDYVNQNGRGIATGEIVEVENLDRFHRALLNSSKMMQQYSNAEKRPKQ